MKEVERKQGLGLMTRTVIQISGLFEHCANQVLYMYMYIILKSKYEQKNTEKREIHLQ